MSKHIPGPWEIGAETYFHGERSDNGKSGRSLPLLPIKHSDDRPFGREIALVWYSLRDQGEAAATDLANARLIAAAPDLLDGLKDLLRHACRPDDDGPYDDAFDEARTKCRAAIAKAEGPP